jgi:hypothetical protein
LSYLYIFSKSKWGLGIGDWGLGIGDWGLGPIPNPQSPIPNPQSPFTHILKIILNIKNQILYKKMFLFHE